MRVFITGGAGYIGSAAARRLLEAGHQVTVFDSLVTGHRQAVPEEATFVHADLADTGKLRAALGSQAYDAILHFAAFIEAGESMRSPGKYFHNNLALSLGLIEAGVQAGIRRLVFSSSAAVYASSEDPLSETAPLGPANVYGQTKLMIEQALDWYRQTLGLRFAALRYFNAAGAVPGHGEAHRPESHLIPLVLQVALEKRPAIQVYGQDYPTPDGTCIRDYVHVADLVEAHLLALDALEDTTQMTYNLGNGQGYSVREVIEAARRITSAPIPSVESPRRPGDPPRLVAASDRIKADLGWSPAHPGLDDIIESAWVWHRSHPDGYADLPART